MTRESGKPPKKQTHGTEDGKRSNRLAADLKKRLAEEVPSAELLARMHEQQELLELRNEQLDEANASLERSQQRYADLYNLAPVGYITLDAKACIREINHTAAELLGSTNAHLIGRPLVPYLAQPDRKVFLKHLWQCRHAEKTQTITLSLASVDQGKRLVEFTTRPAQDFESRPGWCHAAITDVTERRRIEEALSASEAKFRVLAENIGDVFWFMELDPMRVTFVSPRFEQIWGVPVAELYADHELWMKSIHPDDLEAVRTAFDRWIAGETSHYQIEYRVLTRQGQVRWIVDRGIVIGCMEGRPHEISGIARDVTDRKEAEKALAEKASETNAILEGTHDGILIADVETRRFTFGNRAICVMLDVTPEALLNMGIEDIHPQELLPDLVRKFDAMASGELSLAENVPLLREDGSTIAVDITASSIVIKGRKCNLGIFHDISERKGAEERFRGLLESAPDAMVIVDKHGLIVLVNAQAVKLFGYTRDEMIGHSMEMLVPERVRAHHVGQRANYSASPDARPMAPGMELSARRKDGSEFPVEISLSPLDTANGMLVISAVRDISEQVRIKHEIQHARNLAESTLEAVPASVAVIDGTGTIVSTNRTWAEFAEDKGCSFKTWGVGANYVAACDAAAKNGVEEAARFAAGIRDVMSGTAPSFSMEYPCHLPTRQRWFVGYVTPFSGNGPHSAVIAHVDVSERKIAEEVIQRLNEELEARVEQRTLQLQQLNSELQKQISARKMLEKEILHISEREQQRIGQDLHDDLGQQLAGIRLLSEVMQSRLAKQGSSEVKNAGEIASMLKEALSLTRSLSRGLHPVALQVGGLPAALDELATRTSQMFRIDCRCKCPRVIEMDNTTATHLYRIAQEAVTNAVKHGLTKEIDLELSINPHHTVLSVKDQGKGIAELNPKRKGMGTRIMRYRSDMIGGILEILRNPSGIGTAVVCTILTPGYPPSIVSTQG